MHSYLYTSAQARELDQNATRLFGVPSYVLMQRAATTAAQFALARWPLADNVAVFVGPGNNGGDGYLVALALKQAGRSVTLFALHGVAPSKGDAQLAAQAWLAAGGQISALQLDSARYDLIVDALFGIGLTRDLDAAAGACVAWINQQPVPKFSLDIPSGLDADTGALRGCAVRATVSMCFIAHKLGLYTGAAADHCGELVFADLNLPADLLGTVSASAKLLQRGDLTLPRRARAAHKGSHGHVLVIGGDQGFAGAVRLCGESALRSGAGLVSVATRQEHVGALLAARPELMVRAVQSTADLADLAKKVSVLALGPGLGQADWALSLFAWSLALGKPAVLDADALNLLAAQPRQLNESYVLTPHPGEAARLLGTCVSEVEKDRPHAVRELARRYQAVVVLKGAGTLIGKPDGEISVCPFGNPGMASGGMGDVLTGVIAALMAQHLPAFEAARIGVLSHALAADAAALEGERGLLASDLFPHIRRLLNMHA